MRLSTPTIGLCSRLRVGAARAAHSRCCEVFDELGLRPDIVAGASIGAIIGHPYCAGYFRRKGSCGDYLLSQTRDPSLARHGQAAVDARRGEHFSTSSKGEWQFFTLMGEKSASNIYWPDGIPGHSKELQTSLLVGTTDFLPTGGRDVRMAGPFAPSRLSITGIPGVV